MRTAIFTAALLLFSSSPILARPQPITEVQLIDREHTSSIEARFVDISDLWKRKGGGGGGGKGGGSSSGGSSSGGSSSSGSSSSSSGSSSSGSSSSGSSSSSSGSTSSSSGSKPSTGKGSTTSNTGGSTKQGSGVQPTFGGGRFYSGGAVSPYAAGRPSPLGIAPFFLAGAALAAYPGFWPHGVYNYPYNHPYTFHNRTATNATQTNSTNTTTTRRDEVYQILKLVLRQDSSTGENQTKPVTCLCAADAECGCDDSGNFTVLDTLIGDGTYANLNLSLVNVADINGTSTIILNGTLANGTTISGGTEDANAAGRVSQSSGLLALVTMITFMVFFI